MRSVALLFAFLLGLASSMAGLRYVAHLNKSESGGRLEHLRANKDDYDLIVLGPSFTQLHFIPPVFDARMKELGHDVHSFSFGLSALRGAELEYYLTQILELDMPKLKWIFCDVSLNQQKPIDERNAFTRRVIYWNDPAQLPFMLTAIFKSVDEPLAQIPALWRQLRHTLMKVASVGEGVEGFRQETWFGKRPRNTARSAFHINASTMKVQAKKAERYLKRSKHAHTVATKKLVDRRRKHMPHANAMMVHWRDMARAHDVESLFVISPVLGYSEIATEVQGADSLQVLDFNDPKGYPELYKPELHYDRSHLHYRGALVFSHRLAEVFAARLDEQGKARAQ